MPFGHVCKLNKVLYGLKQAPRQWYKEFSTKIEIFGFRQSVYDHYLFLIHNDQIYMALLVYVDAIFLIGDSS